MSHNKHYYPSIIPVCIYKIQLYIFMKSYPLSCCFLFKAAIKYVLVVVVFKAAIKFFLVVVFWAAITYFLVVVVFKAEIKYVWVVVVFKVEIKYVWVVVEYKAAIWKTAFSWIDACDSASVDNLFHEMIYSGKTKKNLFPSWLLMLCYVHIQKTEKTGREEGTLPIDSLLYQT